MDRELDSRFSGPGSSPGWGIALCSWVRHVTFITVSLRPGVRMSTGEFNVGENPIQLGEAGW